MEIRVDRERSSVFHHNGVETLVRPFPISTDFTGLSLQVASEEIRREAQRFQERYSLYERHICVGVDRIDYTKGIPERLHALDRLFTKYPQYRHQIVFLQAGPESRIHIRRYKELNDEVSRWSKRSTGATVMVTGLQSSCCGNTCRFLASLHCIRWRRCASSVRCTME